VAAVGVAGAADDADGNTTCFDVAASGVAVRRRFPELAVAGFLGVLLFVETGTEAAGVRIGEAAGMAGVRMVFNAAVYSSDAARGSI
jgi:hypothetical protein